MEQPLRPPPLFIGENVYLFCAPVGLTTVVRGSVDKDAFAKAMKLKSTQWIVLAQDRVPGAKLEFPYAWCQA